MTFGIFEIFIKFNIRLSDECSGANQQDKGRRVLFFELHYNEISRWIVLKEEEMTFKRYGAYLLLLAAALALGASIAVAQDATPEATAQTNTSLTYSSPAKGEITNANFSQIWTLQAASADRISIHVERTSGNLIPDLALLDSNSQQLTTGYNQDGTDATADLSDYTLPAGGTFQVLVQRKDGGSGVTSGTYTILVTPEATADDNPVNMAPVGELTADTPVSGEITGAHWYQRYTYNAQGADVISVDAKRTDGTLFPQIEVLDANGTNLTTGYTNYAGDDALLDHYELPSAGTYTIAVTRNNDFSGYTLGTYNLTLTVNGAGEDNPMLSGSMGNVAYDTELKGDIGARWYEDWTLVTKAGDTITATVTRTAGNLQPEVIIVGGSGQELSHGYTDHTGGGAEIDNYKFDGPGTYTIRVSRNNGKKGVSTGSYSLKVSLEGAGTGSDTLQGATGDLKDNTPTDGKITGARWADTWTYTGKKGAKVDILVTRKDGTLIPVVDIRDSNGQTLQTGYPSQSEDSAEITSYALPGDGQYQIVVYRNNQQDGYTTGDYTITVKPAASS